MEALLAFLRRSPAHLAADAPLLVLGNEAADLDSIVCAITHAFGAHVLQGRPAVPLINIPRAELSLRPEVRWLLDDLRLPTAALTFTDDVDLSALEARPNAGVVLVDHNLLCPSQEHLGGLVRGVIDHHADEGRYVDQCADCRVIRPVGSAATLVAERLLAAPAFQPHLTPPLAKLLLAPILLDTVNLDPAHHKVTPADEAMAAALLTMLAGPAPADRDRARSSLFEMLQKEKQNTSRLSLDDSLRRDFKTFTFGGHAVGIASVLDGAEALAAKDPDRFFDVCDAFAAQHHLTCLLVMCAFSVGEEFQRELIVLQPAPADPTTTTAAVFDTLTAALEGHPDLTLRPMECPLCRGTSATPAARFYRGLPGAFSRKRLAPLIATFF